MSYLDNYVLCLDANELVCWTRIRDLDPLKDKVYAIKTGQFIPFKIYKSDKTVKTLIHIKENGLGHHRPFNDIYLPEGLTIEYRRDTYRVSKLPPPLWERIQCKESRYALCTTDGEAIDLSGVPVWSWREASWSKIDGSLENV